MKQYFFLISAVLLIALNASFAMAETLQDRQRQRAEKIENLEKEKERRLEELAYTKKSHEELEKTNKLLEELVDQNMTIIKQNRDLNDLLTVFVSEFTDFDAEIDESSFEDEGYQEFEAVVPVVPVEPVEFSTPPIEDDGLEPLSPTESQLLIEVN